MGKSAYFGPMQCLFRPAGRGVHAVTIAAWSGRREAVRSAEALTDRFGSGCGGAFGSGIRLRAEICDDWGARVSSPVCSLAVFWRSPGWRAMFERVAAGRRPAAVVIAS